MNKPMPPAGSSPVEPTVRHHDPVRATWVLELNCYCPACDEYVDLLRYPDFWDGRQSMQACEHGTPRTTGMEVQCPNCDAEFEVDCEY